MINKDFINKHAMNIIKIYLVLIILSLIFVVSSIKVQGALSDNLTSYWSFDEGTGVTTFDSLLRSNGTLSGATWNTTGKINGSVSVVNSAVYTQAYATPVIRPLTLNFWMKGTGSQSTTRPTFIMSNRSSASGLLYVDSATSICLFTNNQSCFTKTVPAYFEMWTIKIDGNGSGYIYINGSKQTFVTDAGQFYFNITSLNFGNGFVGGATFSVDEAGLWSRNLTDAEIVQLFNSGNGLPYTNISNTTILYNDVTLTSQTPTNITQTSLLSVPYAEFNYTYRNQSTNLTSLKLNYSISGSLTCIQNINGTCVRFNNTYTTVNNVSSVVSGNTTFANFQLNENDIYPYLINLNGSIFNLYTPSLRTQGINDLIKSNLSGFNVSLNTYNILEVMANVSSGSLSRVYICNNTYTTGNVGSNANCQEIGSINTTTMNHTHNANSSHNVIPFSIVGSKINGNGITATTNMFFVIARVTGTGYVYYVTNQTTTTTTQTSGNNGVTYSNLAGTINMHVHDFPLTNDLYLNYKGQALFNNSILNSTTANELIDTVPFPPTPPQVTNPFNTIQNTRYLNITYTNATQNFSGVNISYYSIRLLDDSSGVIRVLNNNNYNNSYNLDVYSQNLSLGQYYIQVCAFDTLNNNACDQEYFNLTKNGLVTITAKNYTGSAIQNFSVNTTDLNTSELYYNTTTTYNITQDIIVNNTYSLFFNSLGYAYQNFTQVFNTSIYAYQVTLFPSNSVNITIYDEATNAVVTQNTTVRFELSGSATSYTYTTTSGNMFPTGLTAGNYTVTFTSLSPIVYTVRFYNIEIGERSTQVFSAFLNNGGAVILNYRDQSGSPLPGVSVLIQRSINSTFVTVESLTSQIDGRTSFNYLASTRYRIVSTLSGYDNLTFELNPVLFSSYDVTMINSNLNSVEPTAFAFWSPTSFYRGQVTDLNFNIISQYCSLNNYTLRTKLGVLQTSSTGTLPCGQIILVPFDMSAVVSGDTYTVYYEYYLNNGAYQNFTFVYPIVVPLSNRTLTNMGTQFFGLGTGDRVFIVVFLNILAFGVGFLVSGTGFGSMLMMGNILIFMANGFVPGAVFYVTLVLAIILLMGRGVNDG